MNDEALVPALSEAIATQIPRAAVRARGIEKGDGEIIDSIRNGDTESFGILVRKYEDFVLILIRGIVLSEEMARDVAQETFLRAYRGIRRFESKSSFKTWLYRIAYNTAMSHLKGRSVKTESIDETCEIESPGDAGSPALKMRLQKLIGLLKPELKAVIIFRYYDDLKYEEMAEILNCPIGTVKIRLFRAKHDLRKLWEKHAV